MKINYQLKMEETIEKIPEGERPKLLLQCCCAPCSSYVLKALTAHFRVLVYFYNPNIHPIAEYEKRRRNLDKLIERAPYCHDVQIVEAPYAPEAFFEAVQGLENEPEGGARCTECFRLRLIEAAKQAKALDLHWFTTTLTVSPHKNVALLNALGEEIGAQFGVQFLPSDFKKKEGYKQSITLSREFDLYRQNYCGCVFSERNEEAAVKPLKD